MPMVFCFCVPQAVMAFDPSNELTPCIPARGRAGSHNHSLLLPYHSCAHACKAIVLFAALIILQAVIAFDPPKEVTPYIQARGRARKAGSHYYWLAPDSLEADPKLAISFEMQKRQQ